MQEESDGELEYEFHDEGKNDNKEEGCYYADEYYNGRLMMLAGRCEEGPSSPGG